ncbi:hypothetical protein SY83_15370 [Paenibacillus swuensis]|uniref:Uncharacterized protein n=2 Tax=Paenibacillus swuensis TaxID=1178515 RepID=A0A172TKC5_9BACL|nr:hypothetical protein SY83_15370 [Paenibacillus swuensis]
MEAIRTRIQPKFAQIGAALKDELSMMAGEEMFLHIAQHARRKTNAPVDTWMALAANKRGYKQHPHFQVGLFDDHIFIWLAFIYELPNKQGIANQFMKNIKVLNNTVPANYVLSFDHMKKDATDFGSLGKAGLKQALQRFHDVKKAELLIGRQIKADDAVLQDGQAFLELVRSTYETLIPLYKLAH